MTLRYNGGMKKEVLIMKSSIFRVVAVMLVVVCLFGLTACGGGGNSAFDGKWESAYMDMAGMKAKTPGIMLEIKGASGTFSVDGEGAKQSAPVKVEYKDSKAVITVDGTSGEIFPAMHAVITDGNLVIEDYLGAESGIKLILTKDLKNFKFPDGIQE